MLLSTRNVIWLRFAGNISMVRAVSDLINVGNELASLAGPTWGPVVSRWHEVVERGRDLQERHDAYTKFEPYQWWA